MELEEFIYTVCLFNNIIFILLMYKNSYRTIRFIPWRINKVIRRGMKLLVIGLFPVVLQGVAGYLREEENTVMRNGTLHFLSCGVDKWSDAENLSLPSLPFIKQFALWLLLRFDIMYFMCLIVQNFMLLFACAFVSIFSALHHNCHSSRVLHLSYLVDIRCGAILHEDNLPGGYCC